MQYEDIRLHLWQEIADYLFKCFTWTSLFDDHGHFNVLALNRPALPGIEGRLLQYQRAVSPAYARYCEVSGVAGEGKKLLDWPPLPVECFKRADVSSVTPENACAEFYSSGTTTDARSVHRFRDTSMMQKAIIYQYASLIGRGIGPGTPIFSLMPSCDDNPHSSLAYMISYLMQTVGGPQSRAFFSMDSGLDVDGLLNALRDSEKSGTPVHLMGPAFAYVELLDAIGNKTFSCAPNSALLETGGYKGRSREIPKNELRDLLAQKLGIDRRRIYGEYGMCELSSQAYELSALNAPVELIPEEGLFIFPPWMRCIIYSPDSMRPVLPDNDGQIALFDICNIDSAAYILTGDLGRLVSLPDALRMQTPGHPKFALKLYGRAPSAVPKGCSMAWDEWAAKKS